MHTERQGEEHNIGADGKLFFKLFAESTLEGSRAAARKMKKIVKPITKVHQNFLLFHNLYLLVHSSNSDMLSWPNSPLLVLLQFVDPDVLTGEDNAPVQEGVTNTTPLHRLAERADPFDYSTHVNQLILAKQLIERGVNVNALSSVNKNKTPLHTACFAGNVTNLDFVGLLLKAGADPNAQDHVGMTPLMYGTPHAPGATKFLLNWPAKRQYNHSIWSVLPAGRDSSHYQTSYR